MAKEPYLLSLYAVALRASTDKRALKHRNEETRADKTRKREKDKEQRERWTKERKIPDR